jgi:hypothetical protein
MVSKLEMMEEGGPRWCSSHCTSMSELSAGAASMREWMWAHCRAVSLSSGVAVMPPAPAPPVREGTVDAGADLALPMDGNIPKHLDPNTNYDRR